jgi:hypothetical protein
MIKVYVTLRPIVMGKDLMLPNLHLENAFKGLDVKYDLIAMDRALDGRMLVKITIGEDSSYTSQQLIDYEEVVLEGLQVFSCHKKTLASAEAFAEAITGASWQINGDVIEMA